MNIFNDDNNQQNTSQNHQSPNFFNSPVNRQHRVFLRSQTSNADIYLTGSEEILKRGFMIILCAAGIVSILIVLCPYFRLLIEFCWWAFKKAGTIF